MDFKEQVAVITGAASGIGLAVAKQLLESGARLVLLDINDTSLQKEFGNRPQQVLLFPIDITNQSEVDKAINTAATHWGRIHILVNCAGITGVTNIKSHEVNTEDLQRVFNINFMASFYTAHAVLPYMIKQAYGRILHVASIAGKEGNAGMLAYSASKAAVIGMTKVQGKEYAEMGITVNALAPAVIRTPLVDAMPAEQVKYMTNKIPMKRCGTLEEAVHLILYIVSPANTFTTGFTFICPVEGLRISYSMQPKSFVPSHLCSCASSQIWTKDIEQEQKEML
ncbi:SDR family NAD(P)-dependent oxidoreductase [Segetibacter aerophilus]|uniref:3-oxoacyl-ACP reductase n=1 Tax=Segetibacter aerophilus TaxID=670293 RepID=A0A512BIT5_9BACT|nr:SDR family NAD(P)-dependent oxidoreductase [Segetibacter aerophilus]GEO11882.1 3-oxoacyl-ACP reductase [Segetibacter aerophilus]